MAITVAQALKIGGLQQGRVLAGKEQLDNIVEHVNIIEALLEKDWETGWEAENHLLLTTFNAARHDVENQKRIMEIFHKNGCAGLVFQRGVISGLSPQVVQHAEELGLPLIQVPEPVSYPAIITPLVGAILRDKSFLLERAQKIHSRLSQLIMSGGGLPAIAAVLRELISAPVAITDAWGDLLASAGFDDLGEAIALPPSALSTTDEREPIWDEDREMWFVPLLSGEPGSAEGFILVRDPEEEIDRFEWIAVEQAATIAVLDLVKQRAVLEAERRLKRDFVEDLLGGGYHSVEAMLARARSLGWDLRRRRVVALVDLNRFEQYTLSHIELGEEHFQRVKDRLLRAVSRAVSRQNPSAILADRSDSIVLLPHFDDQTPPSMARSEMQRLAEAICDEARGQPDEPSISIAIGGFCESVAELCHSYREAQSALRVGLRMAGLGSIIWYDDVALYTLLDRIGTEPETGRWLHRTLGPLVAYDRENGTEMVKTLEVYFDANQVIKVAADDLFIHPKTLKYRLQRIEEILGSDPFSGDQQLRFYLATKMAELLHSASHLD